jgi:hypothetical protein
MKLADFGRLKKFMALAESDNDPEALAALRAANALIRREGLTWQRVLDRSVKVIEEVEAAPEDYSEPKQERSAKAYAHSREPVDNSGPGYDVRAIDDAIATIERKSNLKGSFEDIITSIIEQHRAGKKLSYKQRDLLIRTADR